MGSVKKVRIIEPAAEDASGVGNFIFSDDFSVFDWGKMPDAIPGKGAALAVMSAFNFEQLRGMGIESHYIGLVYGDELIHLPSIPDRSGGSEVMQVEMAVVYKPVVRNFVSDDCPVLYDYSFFGSNRAHINNYLVPLEVIFRNGLPRGSSVFNRLKKAKGDAEATKTILDKLGLNGMPEENSMLPRPIIGYTTKLEEGDRHLTAEDAYQISGLSMDDFNDLERTALLVDSFITERAAQTGLGPHWDGKVEFRYQNGVQLVDVLGTLDENRFGSDVSKEFLRQWYHANQPEFPVACSEYKKSGPGWQERCPVEPVNMPAELVQLAGHMYQAAANLWVGRPIFDCPTLGEVVEELKPYRS